MFKVYALTESLPSFEGCIVVSEASLVQAIYTEVFGPSSLDECESWVAKNCDAITANISEEASHVSYVDEDFFVKPSSDRFHNTTFEISEKTPLVPRREEIPLSSTDRSRCSVTIYGNGTEGTQVTNHLYFLGQGGHAHGRGSRDPAAVGTINPSSFTLVGPYPQNFPQVMTCGEASGEVLLRSVARFPNGEVQTFDGIATATHQGALQAMPASTGVVQVGQTGSHGSNHWGTPQLCSALASLGAAFHAKFNKPIYLNDMSLPWGGLFDINGNLRPPHITHREGRNADLNYSSMSEDEAEFFKTKAQELGFSVDLHGTPLHWHLFL